MHARVCTATPRNSDHTRCCASNAHAVRLAMLTGALGRLALWYRAVQLGVPLRRLLPRALDPPRVRQQLVQTCVDESSMSATRV